MGPQSIPLSFSSVENYSIFGYLSFGRTGKAPTLMFTFKRNLFPFFFFACCLAYSFHGSVLTKFRANGTHSTFYLPSWNMLKIHWNDENDVNGATKTHNAGYIMCWAIYFGHLLFLTLFPPFTCARFLSVVRFFVQCLLYLDPALFYFLFTNNYD